MAYEQWVVPFISSLLEQLHDMCMQRAANAVAVWLAHMATLVCASQAKKDGFLPGGASMHLCMTPHGPDTSTFEQAVRSEAEQPQQLAGDTLAFMFETTMTPRITTTALSSPCIDRE